MTYIFHTGFIIKILRRALFVIRKLKWPLNIAICLYLLLIPAIIITGGFEIDPLGVNMNHISN
jgi:hypothetical protein